MTYTPIYILGGAQTDFSQKYIREDKGIGDILAESFLSAKEMVKLDWDDIESIHIGNFVGELFCGQGLLGGVLAQHIPELRGKPSSRHEAACASGSMAILAGIRDIQASIYNVVAVSGVEMMRNVHGKLASEHLGAAAHFGHEAEDADYVWVSLFSDIRDYYQERYGVKGEHLAEISKINYANAKRNPLAQTRTWELTTPEFSEDDIHNPIIEGSLRKSDCARITDGAATIFLASQEYAAAYAHRHALSLEDIPCIKGWGHTTSQIQLESKLREHQSSDAYAFPHLQKAISDALDRSGLQDATELDVIETHDCFTISEYIALEHFGLTPPGEAWKVIESGDISFNGKLPVNPSGGLIGSGHPVGATGVRMMLDGYKQVTGSAGDYQVDNTKNVGILNIGGSFTTVASFIVGHQK